MIIDFLKDKKWVDGKKRLMSIRITGDELTLLRVKAMKFTDGNVSEWLRYAGLHLLPPVHHINFGDDADPDEMEFYGEGIDVDSRRYEAVRRELRAFSRKFKILEQSDLPSIEDEEEFRSVK